tara:strand:- start:272 stop:625 length:354 start_codon:yes stop_codon:yes gene_type:complete
MYLKKIRSVKYLSHIQKRQTVQKAKKEKLQKAIEAKKAKDATFFDWLKNFEEQNPDAKYCDSGKIIENRNDVIKWTKKLYDMNKHDRFMSLIKTEEIDKQFKEKMEITEEQANLMKK